MASRPGDRLRGDRLIVDEMTIGRTGSCQGLGFAGARFLRTDGLMRQSRFGRRWSRLGLRAGTALSATATTASAATTATAAWRAIVLSTLFRLPWFGFVADFR